MASVGVGDVVYQEASSVITQDHYVRVIAGRMEAIALIKAAAECRKKLRNGEGERAVADLYLQAALKFLSTSRLQEDILLSGVIPPEAITRSTHLHNYADAALTLDQCSQIYEKFSDYRKAAVCHILLGVARTKLHSVVAPTTRNAAATVAMGKPFPFAKEFFQGVRFSNEATTGDSDKPLLKDPIAVGLFTSLHAAHERFSQGFTNIPPMPDSWIRASRCFAAAEAAGAPEDTKYTNSLLEVRKMCNMAMFGECSDRFLFQAHVAIEALNGEE
ncbi:hypothetical protein R1sor_022377 [Riccia sorocarpa]|uniref:Uncharacterized protein n=1 Tax=Riccia sorocarpa TaxID=122646 RepID=A0ABD3GNH9_9MARC